ncbi:MAG TPA: hypothetical protein PK264_07385 [Hyphomicrobiaceae bacterium]|nr:hypothetical protein [Hyphomicrobiaceae bacterium]
MSNTIKISAAAIALVSTVGAANAAAPAAQVPGDVAVAAASAPVISDAARAQILGNEGWQEARHSKTSNTWPCAKCHTKHSKSSFISELKTTLPAGVTALAIFETLSRAS